MMDRSALQVLMDGRHYLLLQGPMGSFFQELADWLRSKNRIVHRVIFNAGDKFYCKDPDYFVFNQTANRFSSWLDETIRTHHFDTIICFGDCRPMHLSAKQWASQNNIRFLAFEEGYLRPNFITLEEGGVNAFSSMPKVPQFYRYFKLPCLEKPKSINGHFAPRAWAATCYYIVSWFQWRKYPHYHHHKIFSPWKEMNYWIRSAWRKQLYQLTERNIIYQLSHDLDKQYYLAILQVYNDSQIKNHSPYEDVREYIEEVIRSFAKYAPQDKYLVFKHHPMDRGHRYYGKLIEKLCSEFNIKGRVLYVHDLHLPTMLKHAKSVVTINSTAGLSAIHHAKSLKVMGNALYDIKGLTYQHSLDRFWSCNFQPDMKLYHQFRNVLLHKTQLNGVFYSEHLWMQSPLTTPATPQNIAHIKPTASHRTNLT